MRFVVILGFLVISVQVTGQHHLGSLILDFNTGIETYNTTNTYQLNDIGGLRDTVVDAQTGNSNTSLGLEVGIGRFIGVGIRGKANLFYRALDRVTQSRGDVTSTDLLAMINLHPLPFKSFDLVLGAEFGLSNLKFDVNDLEQTLVTGRGVYFSINLNPRLYIKRFGFNVKAAFPVFSYNELQRDNDTGDFILSKWKASGLGLSLGIQYRFY